MVDKHTRGKTAPGRLRALDEYLLRYERELLTRTGEGWASALFVDLGFGEYPYTTLEASRRFRAVAPGLKTVGVEGAAHRVANAQMLAEPGVLFRQGGFECLEPPERARLIRVVNVLREYPPAQVQALHQRLVQLLLPGGLLVEGTTDKNGSLTAVHLIRRTEAGSTHQGLLFHTRFERGFAPIQFRDWLPQDLRRKAVPGHPLHDFFLRWTESWQRARPGLPPAQGFAAAAEALAERDLGVVPEPWQWAHGYLHWRGLYLMERTI